MNFISNNWLTAAIASGLFMALKTQILNIIIGVICYATRSFDKDGDPNTPERGQLLNGAKGEWGDITVLKYDFPLQFGAGVAVEYPDGGVEHILYPLWFTMRKRDPPPKKEPSTINV